MSTYSNLLQPALQNLL